MKHVLVTGCAGFIGSHVCQKLLDEGYRVTGIDCLTTNYSRDRKKRNLNELTSHPFFHWMEDDLRSMNLHPVMEEIDYVYHKAALPGVRYSWDHFRDYTEHNMLATQKLLEAAKQQKRVRKVIYASSSSVYGGTEGPVHETQLPAPYSPYGVSKLAGEHLCRLYYQNYGVPVVSLRYFTVYGPYQREDMAFHRFIKSILENRPISVYGDGKQTRDFTYIDDVVQANIRALEKGIPGEVYNVGSQRPIELVSVIQMIGEIVGCDPRIEYRDKHPGDPKHTWADTGKIQNDFSYQPEYPLKKGLKKQIDAIRHFQQIS